MHHVRLPRHFAITAGSTSPYLAFGLDSADRFTRAGCTNKVYEGEAAGGVCGKSLSPRNVPR